MTAKQEEGPYPQPEIDRKQSPSEGKDTRPQARRDTGLTAHRRPSGARNSPEAGKPGARNQNARKRGARKRGIRARDAGMQDAGMQSTGIQGTCMQGAGMQGAGEREMRIMIVSPLCRFTPPGQVRATKAGLLAHGSSPSCPFPSRCRG
ncbi:hypothetical protein AA21291_0034 [Swaminathania salitolerans LMG 21291]|uniref:Uncharacterized protein n=1 Tax=Swaminathania salitolerans TaxID=182838 RepID=A0A511BKY2_9PROT|nr:hypothetical protein AA21291_0034 [Swaminathania salitolerans LMG 21291]GEL01010.1 hypothetical protein SSA02_01730 [Swaminathania salitolerans]